MEIIEGGLAGDTVGQCTANCINDAYTSHGWVSVWAWVQSALLPETVVAIAGSCAGKCAGAALMR